MLNMALSNIKGITSHINTFNLPNLAVAFLYSFLKTRGFELDFVNFFTYEKEKLDHLLGKNPKSVVITTTFYYDNEALIELINYIRQRNVITKIIVGGPRIFSICNSHSKTKQDYIFRQIGADIYVNDSHGQNTLQKILECLGKTNNLTDCPNLIIKHGRQFERTPRIPEKDLIGDHPIDWSLFKKEFYTPSVFIRTSIGCPFSCSFCSFPTFADKYHVENVASLETELKILKEAGVRNLMFIDDSFNIPLDRFKEICKMIIKNNFNFKWVSFFRGSSADDETFKLMKESGCFAVYLGIESGSDLLLGYMNKKAKIEKYKYVIENLTKVGITTFASLICGFPGETEETVKETIKFMNDTPTTFYNVHLYLHSELTPIHERKDEFKIVGSGYNWSHFSMNWKQASNFKLQMLKGIKNSLQLPLYSGGIWSLLYILEQGIEFPEYKRFIKMMNVLSNKCQNDMPLDKTQTINSLSNVFSL